MWVFIANYILRNRFFIIGIITLLTVFFGYHAYTSIKLENRYGLALPKDSETAINYEAFKKRFGEDGNTVVIAIQTDSLYTKENFKKWKELGDSILGMDGVEGRESEATLYCLQNDTLNERFKLEKIYDETRPIDSVKQQIRSNPAFKDLLFNGKSNVSLMMIRINEEVMRDKSKWGLIYKIEDLARSYEPRFGQIHIAGLPYLKIIIGTRVHDEMFLFIGLSLFVTSVLLYIFFRSFRVVGIALTVVAIAVIWAMGVIGFLEYRLSPLMALIPPLMIVIGVPNCVFLLTKFHQEVKEHGNKIKALSRVIQKIGTATFLTNFTTALGFGTFMFTNSEKLIEFGIAAPINIMMVFVLSLTILPIISSFTPQPKERHLKHLDRKFARGFISKVLYLTQYKRKWVYGVSIFLVAIGFYGVSKIKTTGNLTSDLPDNDPLKKDMMFLEKNFGGSIPFEIMINYKKKGRLFSATNNTTLEKVDSVQQLINKDTLFSKSISVVDLVKFVNMSYYGHDTLSYSLFDNSEKGRIKKYVDQFNLNNPSNQGMSMKELVDTTATIIRIRCQIKDLGSFEVLNYRDIWKKKIDAVLNPDKPQWEKYYNLISKGNKTYIDTIMTNYNEIRNEYVSIITKNNPDLETQLDTNERLLQSYFQKPDFIQKLRKSIDNQYFETTFTGTSIVAADGTRHLVNNLFSSLAFAIISIAVLMALLFRSWRMVLISMIPNLIPLVITGGIMGFFGVPLKPSTLLVFSIAFGISVDDTIHYLAKYRQELKSQKWNLKECVLIAIKESGLGMFYTSIVLYCGFSVFLFSQFGGTQALGLLISVTLLVAMITNLIVLPSLLLTLDRFINLKSFKEPYFDAYDEDFDIDWSSLQLTTDKDIDESTPGNSTIKS